MGKHFEKYHRGQQRIRECLLCLINKLYREIDKLRADNSRLIDKNNSLMDDKHRLKDQLENLEFDFNEALTLKNYYKRKCRNNHRDDIFFYSVTINYLLTNQGKYPNTSETRLFHLQKQNCNGS